MIEHREEEPDIDALELDRAKAKELEDLAVKRAVDDGMDPDLADYLYRGEND